VGLLNDTIKCPVIRQDGEPCSKDSGHGMPFAVCPAHAITLWRHMSKLAGGTSLATPKARKAG
jgi:hypothetical protein